MAGSRVRPAVCGRAGRLRGRLAAGHDHSALAVDGRRMLVGVALAV